MATTARSTRPPKSLKEDVTPQAPQSTPNIGGGGDFSPFVWTKVGEIQESLGGLKAQLEQNKDALTKIDSDIGKVKSDLAEFQQIRHTAKVLGWVIGIATGGLLTIAGFMMKEVWSVILKPMAMQQVQQASTTQALPPSVVKSPPAAPK